MRIALYNLTTTTKHGGVESYVWEVGKRLAERGHSVTLFGGRGRVRRPYPNIAVRQYPFVPRETWGKNPVLRKSLNLLKLLERLSMARHALPDLVRGAYDVIQVSKPYDFPVAAVARRRSGARVFYNAQGTDFFPGDLLFRKAIDGAYSCSRYSATMVEQRFRFPIDVSYNGFDEAIFRPLPPDLALRELLAPGGAPLLLYVGRLVTFKGLDYLLEAVARLENRGTGEQGNSRTAEQRNSRTAEQRNRVAETRQLVASPYLALAGDGPYRDGLEQRARDLGIAGRVHFLGAMPNNELPRYHAASDVFVLPSTDHETFGIAACEAMACARPVVGAHTGGIPEVVNDGETGFLTPPGDSSALAAALDALLADPALRQRFGDAGRARVLEQFTWDRVTDRVLACWEKSVVRSP
jgi:glycosyltransferase involved in cell wall biosynthesis